MTTLHAQMSFYAGDTLNFDVICKDADGNPVNLSGINIDWLLSDPYGVNVETYSIHGAVTTGGIFVLDMPGGRIGINVPPSSTKNYQAGYYRDMLRLTVPEPGFPDIVVSEMTGDIKIRKPLNPGLVALQTGGLAVHSPTQG